MIDLAQLPVIGICGFSGAGRTTLVLDLVRLLARRGLRTLVIKHDAHGLNIDRRGKDTQLAFAAGADVLARDHRQSVPELVTRIPSRLLRSCGARAKTTTRFSSRATSPRHCREGFGCDGTTTMVRHQTAQPQIWTWGAIRTG